LKGWCMKARRSELSRAWKTLNLIDDWLAGGFARPHPELSGEEGPEPLARESADVEAEQRAGAERAAKLALVAEEVAVCVKCGLSANRTRTVPGEGAIDPPVLLIGEGPGEDEDRTGRPFVGKAGQYLDAWLKPIGLARQECYITNCVKCRPPQNRDPKPEEITACAPYLERQIQALMPRTILCLGRVSAQHVLGVQGSVSGLRGKVHTRKGIPVVVTYHPAAVLRDLTLKRPVWDDLKLLKKLL
jgi:uracil-DNA glycosylase family 4